MPIRATSSGASDAVANQRQNDLLGPAHEAQPLGIDPRHPQRRAPAEDVRVRGVLARVDQKQAVGMRQPMLLGARHADGTAVVPGPGRLTTVVQAIVADRHVAVAVLGAHGQIKPVLPIGNGRLQQAAAHPVFQRRPDFCHAQLVAVKRAPHAGHQAIVLFGAEGERHHDVAAGKHHALAAAVGIDMRSARIVPAQNPTRRPRAVVAADRVHRIAGWLSALENPAPR